MPRLLKQCGAFFIRSVLLHGPKHHGVSASKTSPWKNWASSRRVFRSARIL